MSDGRAVTEIIPSLRQTMGEIPKFHEDTFSDLLCRAANPQSISYDQAYICDFHINPQGLRCVPRVKRWQVFLERVFDRAIQG